MADIYGQLVKAQFENSASDLSNVAGIAYYNTSTGLLKYYDGVGTAWHSLHYVGGALGTPLTGTLTNCTGLPIDGGTVNTLPANRGGTGVANNAASTITVSGSFATTFTVTGATGVTLPTTGTLATLAGTEAFTAKDYQGGTASNTSRLTVPKDTLANLTALTRKQATLVYDTTANALLADDGTNLNQIGGGSGEKNYVTAPSTASGWVASNTGITVGTTTSGLPRANTTKTGILVTGVTGTTDYVRYRFILDDADANKKLKIQFDMEPGTAVASDFEVRMYSNTANDYTTGNTRLSLSTDDSTPASLLPALTGTYRTTFDAPATSAKYLELRIKMAASQAHTLVISDVIVGPGVVVQGAACTEWVSFTPTWTTAGGSAPTTSVNVGYWRRVGDTMQVKAAFAASGSGTGTDLALTLPLSLTIDTTKSPASPGQFVVGQGQWYDDSTPRSFHLAVLYKSATTVYSNYSNVTAYDSLDGADLATSDQVSFDFTIPIAEWAGSGTVNVVQNDVEYAFNTSTSTTASDTTAFGYGPGGATIQAITTGLLRRVQFQTPHQVGDSYAMEIWSGTAGDPWINVATANVSGAILAAQAQNGVSYGMGIRLQAGSATQVNASFGTYAHPGGATYGANGTSYSGDGIDTYKWRVKKMSAGAAVGFGQATTTSLGLVKPSFAANAGAQETYSTGSGLVRSGTYTPTLANVANVASSVVSANSLIWMQVGRVVTCSGYLTTTETAGGPTDTQFTLTLPVVPASNFTALYEAGGTCASKASVTVDNPGQVYATTSAKTVTLQFASTVTTATRDLTYTFTYLTN